MGRYIIVKQITSENCVVIKHLPLDDYIKIYDSLEEATEVASKQLYAKVYDLKWDYSNYLTLFNNYAKAVNHISELEKLIHEKNCLLIENNLI